MFDRKRTEVFFKRIALPMAFNLISNQALVSRQRWRVNNGEDAASGPGNMKIRSP